MDRRFPFVAVWTAGSLPFGREELIIPALPNGGKAKKPAKKKGALPGGGGLPDPLYRGIDPIKPDDSHLYLPVFATLIILGERGRVRF